MARCPDLLAHAIHDRLTGGANGFDVPIQIEDPAKRLRRRTDVVLCRREHDDRRGDRAQVKGLTIAGAELVAGQLVADEQVVDQELQFIAVQLNEVAPPLFKLKVTIRIAVDMRVDLVLFAPQPVRRVQHVEVQDQSGAVDFAIAKIAGHRGKPTATEETAGITHRILAVYALPVRHRRTRDQAGPEQIRP